ncbi:MAG: WD40/YVTN/BNR-like repeat-containing protein [Candidatus Geothermincolia bacterium]
MKHRLAFKRIVSTLLALLLAAAGIGLASAPALALEKYNWSWDLPKPQGNLLGGVFPLRSDAVWAVGDEGTILFYDGSSWSADDSTTTRSLSDVTAVDSRNAWAVGESETILFHNGLNWSSIHATGIRGFKAVDATDPSHVWVVGSKGCILRFDGSNWTDQSVGNEYLTFYGVSAADSTHVWAAGYDYHNSKRYIYFFNGTSWSVQHQATSGDFLWDVYGLDATHAWAVGDEGGVLFFDGGSWSPQASGTTNSLGSVTGVDANHIWASGGTTIFFFDGTSWTTQASNAGDLSELSALRANDVWGVGDAGNIMHLDAEWTSHTYDCGFLYVNDICAVSASRVWAAPGEATPLIMYYNGTEWLVQVMPEEHMGLNSIDAIDANHVWAVGGLGYIFFYNGSAWVRQFAPQSYNINHVSASAAGKIWAVGSNGYIIRSNGSTWTEDPKSGVLTTNSLEGVCALDSSHAWAVGASGTILFYNGTTWSKQTSGTTMQLNDVYAADATHVWAVGQDGTTVFFNGTSWSTVDTGSDYEMLAVNGTDASHVWSAGSSGEVFFYNGSVWNRQATGCTHALRGISAYDSNHVFASGFKGTVLRGVPGPYIDSLSRSSAARGWTGDVNIVGDGTHFVQGVSRADFGSGITVNSTGVSDSTHCTANITVSDSAAAGSRSVTVTSGSESPDPLSGGFSVTASNNTWYLAEGTTAWGFDTYITVENPNSTTVTGVVTYYTAQGQVPGPQLTMKGNTSTTINPGDTLGEKDFSTTVECTTDGKTIAVDRTMTWTGDGASAPEGHSSIGVTAPARTWYLAEGSSAWDFETWLLIQNPNASAATCSVTYMIEGEGPLSIDKSVPANSRCSFNMEDDIGQKNASIKVTSNVPVIPERAMYRYDRREGHDSIGTTAATTDYYLAEGTTAWGFVTYILIQNPNASDTTVTLTYMTPSGARAQDPFVVPANSRKTVLVNDVLPDQDFSTRVNGSKPIIAERAMYWESSAGEACHDSIGLSAAHSAFYLPDGQTSDGRETWTLVQNPNSSAVTVQVEYLSDDNRDNRLFQDTIPANSRRSYKMADFIPNDRAAIKVFSVTSGKKIMVERAMYWSSRSAGTDTIGGYSD